jgi:hypothetical protein
MDLHSENLVKGDSECGISTRTLYSMNKVPRKMWHCYKKFKFLQDGILMRCFSFMRNLRIKQIFSRTTTYIEEKFKKKISFFEFLDWAVRISYFCAWIIHVGTQAMLWMNCSITMYSINAFSSYLVYTFFLNVNFKEQFCDISISKIQDIWSLFDQMSHGWDWILLTLALKLV